MNLSRVLSKTKKKDKENEKYVKCCRMIHQISYSRLPKASLPGNGLAAAPFNLKILLNFPPSVPSHLPGTTTANIIQSTAIVGGVTTSAEGAADPLGKVGMTSKAHQGMSQVQPAPSRLPYGQPRPPSPATFRLVSAHFRSTFQSSAEL